MSPGGKGSKEQSRGWFRAWIQPSTAMSHNKHVCDHTPTPANHCHRAWSRIRCVDILGLSQNSQCKQSLPFEIIAASSWPGPVMKHE